MHKFLHFTFKQFANRHSRPFRYHFGNIFGINFFFQHALIPLQHIKVLRGFVDTSLHLGNSAVTDFCGLFKISLSFNSKTKSFQFLFQSTYRRNSFAFCFPMCLHHINLSTEFIKFILKRCKAFTRYRISFFFQRHLFNFQLQHAPLHYINLCG